MPVAGGLPVFMNFRGRSLRAGLGGVQASSCDNGLHDVVASGDYRALVLPEVVAA